VSAATGLGVPGRKERRVSKGTSMKKEKKKEKKKR
jgi:hypothetical protein